MGKFSAVCDRDSSRILIQLGSLEEAAEARKVVEVTGHPAITCSDVGTLCKEIAIGVGAVMIGRDVLTAKNLAPFLEALAQQKSWSHIPVVVILKDGEQLSTIDPVFERLEPYANVTLLESPVHMSTLVSTVRAAVAHRRRQYQQRDLMDELERSRREAVEANRAKGDFLANVSHEIRTPLGAVIGFSELLMDEACSGREREIYMKTVRRNGQMLSALINDLLDLAKVEAGRIELECIDFSLGVLLSELISEFAPQAAAKGLALVLDRQHVRDDVLCADPLRLKQIFGNVVGNAIKFTSYGSVQVRVDVHDSVLSIEVEDTGIGISSAQATRLFQPFTQADTSSTRRYGGTGLGLTLSRKLARAMGGDLRLKWSIPGGGSCFEILLQVDIVDRAVDPSTEVDSVVVPVGASEPIPPLAGKRILVVDDSPDNQVLIGRILNLLGAGVDLASDGEEAVSMALETRYDLVLMDVQMPRLSGIDATRRLRERGFAPPIVALTSHTTNADRDRCFSVGCHRLPHQAGRALAPSGSFRARDPR